MNTQALHDLSTARLVAHSSCADAPACTIGEQSPGQHLHSCDRRVLQTQGHCGSVEGESDTRIHECSQDPH